MADEQQESQPSKNITIAWESTQGRADPQSQLLQRLRHLRNLHQQYPGVIHHDGLTEWTVEFRCEHCGWPWHLYDISETRAIHLKKTVQCPHCGTRYTLQIDHE